VNAIPPAEPATAFTTTYSRPVGARRILLSEGEDGCRRPYTPRGGRERFACETRKPPPQPGQGMRTEKRSESRQRNVPPIMVRVTAQEKERIKAHAQACGLSAPALLRQLGLGHPVQGVLDQKAVLALVRVNGDLGRLGGLLKMWLSNDERFPHGITHDVLRLFREIEQTQAKLRRLVEAL
jgi:hypothetical protein